MPLILPSRSLTSNDLNAEAAKYLSEGLAKNSALQTLKYAQAGTQPKC